jgi:lipopolysaccharide/colanic/teichoic acid biosynthesis glycosyltransferase
MYPRFAKRVLDLISVVAILPFVAPLMAVLAISIWLRMGTPVLFRQLRPGFREHPFTIWKFRTLTDTTDWDGTLLSDEQRLTALGALLRKTSLDELPQLWNVLLGQMSLVGPRPLLERYLPLYTREEHRRHDVRPGITGWAQIHGRNDVPAAERLALDVWYVDHLSLALDLHILFLTGWKVVRSEGVKVSPGSHQPDFVEERSQR